MNIEIYAVLPDLKSARNMKKKVRVRYEIVYDDALKMAKNMDLLHKGAMPIKKTDLAQPATFLFNSNGKVIWSYISTNYRIRPKTQDILVAAKKHFTAAPTRQRQNVNLPSAKQVEKRSHR